MSHPLDRPLARLCRRLSLAAGVRSSATWTSSWTPARPPPPAGLGDTGTLHSGAGTGTAAGGGDLGDVSGYGLRQGRVAEVAAMRDRRTLGQFCQICL